MSNRMDERDLQAGATEVGDLDKDSKERRRKIKKNSETRHLDPWERYRAISDLYDAYIDIVELLDRKTRFALIILGALNAINILIVVRPNMFGLAISSWLKGYMGIYMILSLYFFVEAILTLKPRFRSLLARTGGSKALGLPEWPGLRFFSDVALQSTEGYYEAWSNAPITQLNRELAEQVRLLAHVNIVKLAALNRLFNGLLTLVFLTASLITVIAFKGLLA